MSFINSKKFLLLLLGIIITVSLVSAIIGPNNFVAWFADFVFLLLLSLVLLSTFNKFRFSNRSYFLIFLFMIFTIYGVHYSMENTPLGFWLQELLGLSRNPYDRIVHFFSGLLLFIPVRELFVKTSEVRNSFWSFFVPLTIIVAGGAIYEVIEWLVSVNVFPGASTLYLGTQGDVWDPQKDMFLSFLGCLTTSLFLFVRGKFK